MILMIRRKWKLSVRELRNALKSLALSCFLTTSMVFHVQAQSNQGSIPADTEYYRVNEGRFEEGIYREGIHSICCSRTNYALSLPMIGLGGNETITLSFDELGSSLKKYMYRIQHCNANGKPSRLLESEFMEGFSENEISTHDFSFGSIQPYIHYQFSLPNPTCKPKVSGSYVVMVYEENQPDQPILIRKFWLLDDKVPIEGTAKQTHSIEERKYQQEVNFSLGVSGIKLRDPIKNISVFVTQNNRKDCIHELSPSMYKGNTLEYIYEGEHLFDGGNEFRHIDLKSLRHHTDRVLQVDQDSGMYQVYLKTDEKRSFQVYETDDDINGKYLIKTEEGKNSETEGEYAWVYFRLKMANPVLTGSVYILGALSDWRFTPSNRLTYDYRQQVYTGRLLLKQGYYNYVYAVLETASSCADISFIEGNHFETSNEYQIWVYYRQDGDDVDQLIGWSNLSTKP